MTACSIYSLGIATYFSFFYYYYKEEEEEHWFSAKQKVLQNKIIVLCVLGHIYIFILLSFSFTLSWHNAGSFGF